MNATPINVSGISDLVHSIQHANKFFLDQTQRQVNTALTLRNWVIGYYIVEYEQKGADRAEYGERLIRNLSERLKKAGIKGLSFRNLQLFKQFCLTYPQIVQTVSAQLQIDDSQVNKIVQSVTAQSATTQQNPLDILLGKLSFTHFVELIKIDAPLKRLFYETEAIVNNWSVRELQRAIDSMLFERTGLSKDKEAVLSQHRNGSGLKPADIFRNPYFLDFLGLEERNSYVETDLEQAIITNLQAFLIEMGRGFCFEARQKRITFENTHYRIDLVFYHRLLRCHVLIDLKMGRFTPADAGQMHMYLNYFKENEAAEGDNPPIGIILCTDKSETLVKYATAGLAHYVFVSKYMTSLPSEQELKKIVLQEQEKHGA
ncbi:MAG TPA: PDDEXK nuclease domain-containing protein [Puia sp.]|nr:PDDEXK nuclease domain-containing protein [Puia sp.]